MIIYLYFDWLGQPAYQCAQSMVLGGERSGKTCAPARHQRARRETVFFHIGGTASNRQTVRLCRQFMKAGPRFSFGLRDYENCAASCRPKMRPRASKRKNGTCFLSSSLGAGQLGVNIPNLFSFLLLSVHPSHSLN